MFIKFEFIYVLFWSECWKVVLIWIVIFNRLTPWDGNKHYWGTPPPPPNLLAVLLTSLFVSVSSFFFFLYFSSLLGWYAISTGICRSFEDHTAFNSRSVRPFEMSGTVYPKTPRHFPEELRVLHNHCDKLESLVCLSYWRSHSRFVINLYPTNVENWASS
jgi:hypothetical protein